MPATGNGLGKLLAKHFDEQGLFKKTTLAAFVPLLDAFKAFKAVRVSSTVVGRLELLLQETQLEDLAREVPPPTVKLKARLYPYQFELTVTPPHR